MPELYNIELLRLVHKDYVVNSGALDYMASQDLPNID